MFREGCLKMLKLILKRRSEIITEFKLSKKKVVTVGSAKGNSLVISDKSISEYHCTITREKGKYILKDNNTLSGTRVNGRIITIYELQFGDKIDLGIYSLQVCSETEKKSTHFLVGIYGKFEGKKYELKTGETYIGREYTNPKGINNDIVLVNDMTCSKGHAKISFMDNQYRLTDIGSTGGTAVNGEKIGQFDDVVIKLKDEVTIGRNIFRIIEEGKENYSPPKRHKILLLKLRKPFYIMTSAVILSCAIFATYRGLAGMSVINYKPGSLDIRSNRSYLPQGNIIESVLPPYDISSSPCISDVNNDSVNDIIYLSPSGLLFVWDGHSGKTLFKPVEIPNSGVGSPAVADMNNDGIGDIICLSNTSMVYIVDGQTGGIVFKDVLGGTISNLSPAVADLNLDGRQDIVVASEEGLLYFIYSPGFDSEVEKATDFVEGPIYASPVIMSTQKISPTIIICSNSSKVFLLNGKTREKKTIDLVEKTGRVHLIAAAPVVGDLDGDDVPEIVVQSNVPQYISVIDITKSKVNWTYFVEPVPPSNIERTSSPIITDIDGDGMQDVVAFSANGMVYAIKGKTEYSAGEVLWKCQVAGACKIISSPALYDFDKNGAIDMVFGTETGHIYILGSSSEFLFESRISNAPITSSVALGDVDGDGYLDIIYSDMANAVGVLATNLKVFKNRVQWPMYLGGISRMALPYMENISLYRNLVIIGVGVCLLLLGICWLIRRKRTSKRPKVVLL